MSTTSLFEGFEAYYAVEFSSKADDGITDLAFTPDSFDMIVATKDYMWLWDYEAEQHRGSLQIQCCERGQTPSRIAYSSDGTSLATATEEGRVILYTRVFNSKITRRMLKGRDGNWLKEGYLKSEWLPSKQAETYRKQKVDIFGINRKEVTSAVPVQHFDLAFSPDGAYLAVAGLDGITVWLVNSSEVVTLKSVEEAFKSATTATEFACYALAFSPDNLHLAIGLEDGKDAIDILHLKDHTVKSKTLSDSKEVGPRRVTSLAYSGNGKLLAVARAGCSTLALLELDTPKHHELSCHAGEMTCVTWSPNGNYIAAVSLDSTVLVWDVATRTCLFARMAGSPTSDPRVCRVSISPDGRFLASCSSSEGFVRLWQAKNPSNFSDTVEVLPQSLLSDEESELEEKLSFDFVYKLLEDKSHYQSSPNARTTSFQPLPSSPGSTNARSINSFDTIMPTLVDYDHLWDLLPQRATPPSGSPLRKHELEIRDWTGYLQKGEVVGGGGFGDVYKGEIANTPFDDRMRCMPVAIKVIRPYIFAKSKGEQVFQYVNREVQIWMSLRHPNIVPFVGISYDFSSVETKLPALLSAWMPNGSLKAYATQHSDAYRAPMLLDIGKGLEFLHGKEHHFRFGQFLILVAEFNPQIVHGDIKAENILVNNDGRLALGDFGLSRMLSDDSLWITSATSAAGTVRWMAPELLDGSQSTVTKESDIYAFAITVVEVIAGKVPFGGLYNFDGAVTVAVVTRDERPPRPDRMKNWLWNLVNDCWTREPSKRLTVSQIIKRLNDVLV